MAESLDAVLLSDMDAYWRAANYLCVGQMYLLANPLLREPLKPEHVKPRVPGDWGATTLENFIYLHLNRVIQEYDLNMACVAGLGRCRAALVANAYLEGTYSERYPDIAQDEEGLRRLFREFSSPGGTATRAFPAALGAQDRGANLDHPLCRAYRAACGQPDLLIACVLGDGEAEARPLSMAWTVNEALNPVTDGAVLPILRLTAGETGNFTILAPSERERLRDLLHGNGHHPHFVEGDEPTRMHALMARILDEIILEIGHIQAAARSGGLRRPLPWPVLIVRAPSGWAGPKSPDGQVGPARFRPHQAPLFEAQSDPVQLAMLETWLRSYRPGELFDQSGKLHAGLADLAPRGERRMSSHSHVIGDAASKDRP